MSWPLPIIILHWLMALMIAVLFVVGDYMVDLDYYDAWYQSAPFWHKSFGLFLFALLIGRLLIRLASQRPEEIVSSRVERFLARSAHAILYVLTLGVCVSGYLISTANGRGVDFFELFEVPALPPLLENQEDLAGESHEWLAVALIVMAVLHAFAALKHHFVDRDSTLKRMLGIKS